MFPSGIKVQLVDKNGKVIAVSKTNERGTFKFFNLPSDDQFLFEVPEDDGSFAIRVINDNQELIGLAKKNDKNQFVYHKFSANPSEKPDIRGLFKYGTLPANDVALNLMDENDNILQFTTTNAQGEFEFRNLDGGNAYHVQVAESEGEVPDNATMYINGQENGFDAACIKNWPMANSSLRRSSPSNLKNSS